MAQLQACYMIALCYERYRTHFLELLKKIKNNHIFSMKLFYTVFLLLASLMFCDAQTLCAKTMVIKPVFSTETVEIIVSPAVYETKFVEMMTRQGFWDVEKKNGVDCKVWRNPETVTVARQVIIIPAVAKTVVVQKTERHGDVITYMSDCQ